MVAGVVWSATFHLEFLKGATMRFDKILLGIVLVILLGSAWYLHPLFVKPPYLQFIGKDAHYHSQFAHACDEILAGHPVGTNKSISIPVTDVSLPEAIQKLHPDAVEVRSNSVWIRITTNTAMRFGIKWEPYDHTQPHLWVLRAIGESGPQQLYSETR